MSASATSTTLAAPAGAAAAAAAASPAKAEDIDLSGRWPLMFLIGKGAGWLVIGSFLYLAALIKLHGPGSFVDIAWLNVGRLRPAAVDALVYGFAAQFGFALVLWMLARLGRLPLLNAPFLFLTGIVWNLGVVLGVIGILAGYGTGFAYLSLPKIAWPFLYVALGLVAIWGLINFHYRRERSLYPSQWFLVAALFWFPWVLSASSYLLVFDPVRGVVQAIVAAWYAHNFLTLWLTPVAIAAVYYFVPKLMNRPLHSRELALFGFWTLAFFGGWGGLARLSGGPIPSWMISVSVAANVCMLFPAACFALNICKTTGCECRLIRGNTALDFILIGSGFYLLATILLALTSFRTISQVTVFTHIPVALDHMILFGFFGLVALGAAYEILPRVLGVPWPCDKLRRWHFLGTLGGLGLYFAMLILGGLIQGFRMNNPEVEFMSVVKSTIPFIGLATLGWVVFFAAQTAFLIAVNMMIWQALKPLCDRLCAGFCGGAKTAQSVKGGGAS